MKITVYKIEAAKAQLLEAINLFFEERDPIPIHTLVGAALGILNDLIADKDLVRDNQLIFHYDTIYIKDKYRKKFQKMINSHKNFFKHADLDLKKGLTTIAFNPELNQFFIFEAIRVSRIIQPDFWPAEYKVFIYWIMKQYPNLFNNVEEELLRLMQDPFLQTKADFKWATATLKKSPV